MSAQFPIAQFKASQNCVLGRGLWGEVVDLRDGTVLKLARRKCAGIGDGWLKIQREVDVLKAIEAANAQTELSIAKVCCWGEYSPNSNDDYELWLQMTKVVGEGRTVSAMNALLEKEKSAIATSIAITLVELHRLLHLSAPSLQLPTAKESLLMIHEEIEETPEAAEGIQYIVQLLKVLDNIQDAPSHVIHGDFNISNILFSGTHVSAVVDFAETRKGFYEEDVAAIVDELPEYQAQIVKAFESAADCTVSVQKLNYGLALRALLSVLIGCRLRPDHDHSKARQQLMQRTKSLLDCF